MGFVKVILHASSQASMLHFAVQCMNGSKPISSSTGAPSWVVGAIGGTTITEVVCSSSAGPRRQRPTIRCVQTSHLQPSQEVLLRGCCNSSSGGC